ncbi:MAG: polysaccharide biosynthesis tyrosine autokinase [Alphaproteobacteria bacterium]|nr:MAG: polysaccharide biosynthesis tyrosine autokinase [Alphaproteobacteria bacterium]
MSDLKSSLVQAREMRPSNVQSTVIANPDAIPYPGVEPSGTTFNDILSRLRRRLVLVTTVFIAVAAAGVIFTFAQTPRYVATALMSIDPNPDQIVPEKQLSGTRIDATAVDSEIEALKAPTLAARLAAEFDLDRDAEWNPTLRKTPVAARAAVAKAQMQETTTDAQQTYYSGIAPDAGGDIEGGSVAKTSITVARAEIRPVQDDVVMAVADALKVRRRGLSNVVEVTAESASPTRAAEMANGLSSIYLKSLSEARYDASERANVWLKDRLDELRREVQQKQAAAQSYRAQRNLLTAQGVSLVEQQVAQIQSSLLQTRAEYSQKQAEHSQLSDISDAGKSVGLINGGNDAMRDLRAKEADVAQRIANLDQRYGSAYPALQEAREEKAALDARIADEMRRVADKSKIERDALAARMRTQEGELSDLRGALVSGNFDQVRLDALETDVQAAQSVYENFLQRYHEIARQGASTGVGARILSVARPPVEPFSPHLLFNTGIAVALAVVAAILAGLLAEQLRGTVETSDEVERRVGVRALVSIPSLRKHDLRHMPSGNRSPTSYLLAKRLSQFAEAFRVLQAAILLSDGKRNKIVAITSAMPAEGKTTLAVGLARVAAIGGQRVIVIDCDIRMRSISRVLGIAPTEGLPQVLSGERSWKDVVGVDQASGAHVLPASGPTSKDLFNSNDMQKLVNELAREYDLVILDCAPVFAVAETRVIASLADAVVVAARAGRTPARALTAAIEQLDLSGANVLGVALNRVEKRNVRRSFYDGLYYSKAFKGYYTHEA